MTARDFPTGFRFGAATAAIQIEGASDLRGASIWDSFCLVPGAVSGGHTADVACDHYHRLDDDLDLMARLGLQAYRFSISWPRVLPDGRRPSRSGIDFYKRLLDGLRTRGIEPLATLYHWDLPQALHDAGGWPARETAHRFAEYASLVFEELGELASSWITHNEPWVTAFLGHALGTKAPGRRDWREAVVVGHNVLVSHALAVQAFRAAATDGATIGITLDFAPAYAASDTRRDTAAAARWDGHRNRWFLDAVLRGEYPSETVALYESKLGPLDLLHDRDDLALIAEPIDFLGVNYYSRAVVRDDPSDGPLGVAHLPPTLGTTGMGWEIAPDALYELLVRLEREYGAVPLAITENGSAYDDPVPTNGVVEDPERLEYLRAHLEAVARAAAAGVDVRSYFTWSLLDNFEWEHGYDKRFGIVYVDYATQRRIPKQSALWYRDFIAAAETS